MRGDFDFRRESFSIFLHSYTGLASGNSGRPETPAAEVCGYDLRLSLPLRWLRSAKIYTYPTEAVF